LGREEKFVKKVGEELFTAENAEDTERKNKKGIIV
jgi:hypothetical protein